MDTNASNQLTAIIETGVTGQAYTSIAYEYSDGTYEGYEATYTGLSGSYSGKQVDVNATGVTTEIVESGITGKAYTSVETDYNSSGAVADAIDFYANVTGQSYYADQIELNPSKTQIEQTFDNNDGSHTMTGLNGATGLTFNSIANDTMTGGAAGETFVFAPAFGNDVLTDFSTYAAGTSHDVISLASSQFAQGWQSVLADATNVGANVADRLRRQHADARQHDHDDAEGIGGGFRFQVRQRLHMSRDFLSRDMPGFIVCISSLPKLADPSLRMPRALFGRRRQQPATPPCCGRCRCFYPTFVFLNHVATGCMG